MDDGDDTIKPTKEITSEEIENAKVLANKVDSLNLNPIRTGNVDMGIAPIMIKEEVINENDTPMYSPETENQETANAPDYQPSQIQPVQITPMAEDPTENNPIDPIGLQINKR